MEGDRLVSPQTQKAEIQTGKSRNRRAQRYRQRPEHGRDSAQTLLRRSFEAVHAVDLEGAEILFHAVTPAHENLDRFGVSSQSKV
jgi:hypothetical protein